MEKIEEILFKSEVRMRLLILLNGQTLDVESLCKHLGVDEQTLTHHLRILEEHYLIESHSETYELTTIGKLLTDKLATLIETLDKIDSV